MPSYEYEFERLELSAGGYSLFGGVGIQLEVAPPEVKVIRDTVAALRLDAVAASAFSTSRGKAAELISAGRVAVNHRECTKADRPVAQGDVLTCRGLGKCVVKEVLGRSKKGRIMLVLERYV